MVKALVRHAAGVVPLLFAASTAVAQVSVTATDSLPKDLPLLSATVIDGPSQGSLFFASMGSPTTSYGEIVSDSGAPSFYVHATFPILDLKIQPDGSISYFNSDDGGYSVLDNHYHTVTTVRCVGYPTDNHDLRIMPNGHYLLFGYDSLFNYDISGIVGSPKIVSAIGVVIQELDRDQNVVWQWRGWDEGHFVPEDMQHPETITKDQMDAIHANSIDIDDEGNVLLSSRHLSEVTKIDRQTGNILWRMGGKNNQFTFVNDTLGFSYQHCVRYLRPSVAGQPYHLLLFDNGNYHKPASSRAVEYEIDETARTARLVWQFDHGHTVFTPFMGSVQRLTNGNTLIGWGGAKTPAITEVRPDGSIAYEATLGGGFVSYRAFRFPWTLASVSDQAPLEFEVSSLGPNPAATASTLAITAQNASSATIAVYDVTGKIVQSVFNGRLETGVNLFRIQAQTWPHGAYRVVVESGGQSIVRNLVH